MGKGPNQAVEWYTVDRGVQPAFAYNPHLDFGENFGEKKYFGCINRIYKIGV